MVMGGDSWFKGRVFESQHRLLDGHDIFITLICCKNCIVCLWGLIINEKEAGVGLFKKRKTCTISLSLSLSSLLSLSPLSPLSLCSFTYLSGE